MEQSYAEANAKKKTTGSVIAKNYIDYFSNSCFFSSNTDFDIDKN